jgi:hypothetical protein
MDEMSYLMRKSRFLAIDREIAENEPCPECGGEMGYEADFSIGYRAFAVCKNCGHRIEF